MSVFREALIFFDQIGLYDVVLPFLLVFTLVFGVLEKSKILGTERIGDKTLPRKNLNAMIAFITGFFVVASAQLVELVNILVARVALILVILVCFMILIASMHAQQGDDGFDLQAHKAWLSVVVIIAVVLIFLDGVGWLGAAWLYVTSYWDSTFMGVVLLFIILIGFIMWITSSKSEDKSMEKKT